LKYTISVKKTPRQTKSALANVQLSLQKTQSFIRHLDLCSSILYPVYTIEQTSGIYEACMKHSKHWADIEQTSSRPDGSPLPGSNVGLDLAHSWSRVIQAFQLQPARCPN